MEPDWRGRIFGARLQGEERPGATVLGLYFTFPDTGAADEDFTRRLVELYRTRPDFEVVHIPLWAHTPPESPVDLPWPALPTEDADTRKILTGTYGIETGAPALVLVDAGGEVSRPTAEQLSCPSQFPWRPRSVEEVLEGVALERCGARGPQEPLTLNQLPPSCIKAFYFAAQWCPPCKVLTPQLAETFSLIRRRGHEARLIYVSSDRSREAYQRATEGMPWLSVPWECEVARTELARTLGVRAIPALLLQPPRGPIYEARARAAGDPEGHNFPWQEREGEVNVLCDYWLARLRDQPAVILFVEDDDHEEQWARSELEPAAAEHGSELLFLVAREGDTAGLLRQEAGLEAALPLLTAVDLARERIRTLELGKPLHAPTITTFAAAFIKEE